MTLPKAADQADHKAEQQLMTREWRTPVRRVGDRRDGDGGSQMQAVWCVMRKEMRGGGGEAGEMRAIPIPSSYCTPECCL